MRFYRVLRIAGVTVGGVDRGVDAVPFRETYDAVFRTGVIDPVGVLRADELCGNRELEAVLYGIRNGSVQLHGERKAELLEQSAGDRPESGLVSGLSVSLSAGTPWTDFPDAGDVADDVELAEGFEWSVERIETAESIEPGGDGGGVRFLHDADREL